MNRNSRESESRDNNTRPQYSNGHFSVLDNLSQNSKPGYATRFVNTSIRGEPSYRVEEMLAKGWTVVPKDRLSSTICDPLGRNQLSQTAICYKDVIRMEAPEELVEQAEKEHLELCEKKMKSLTHVRDEADNLYKKRNTISTF